MPRRLGRPGIFSVAMPRPPPLPLPSHDVLRNAFMAVMPEVLVKILTS